jgi:signal peptidase I
MKKFLANQKGFAHLIIILVVIIIAIIIAVGVVIFRNSQGSVVFNGNSMLPTIKSGQEIKVQPYANGQTPQRGDIVEYTSTNSLVKKYAPSGNLIHRVIGLPGDKIVISDNTVTIYNSQNPKGFDPDSGYISSSVKTYPNMIVTVPQGHYFLLGDNRPNALDSRALGAISMKDIIGKVSL